MYIEKLASQIRNDVVSGLRGYHQNLSMNMDQLEDEIVACRLSILHQYFLRGIFPIKDLLIAINCIDVDCESLERCRCGMRSADDTVTAHFEIPQVISQYGKQAIEYIGSTDRQNKFTIVTSLSEFNNRKYRKEVRRSHMFGLILLQTQMECQTASYLMPHFCNKFLQLLSSKILDSLNSTVAVILTSLMAQM